MRRSPRVSAASRRRARFELAIAGSGPSSRQVNDSNVKEVIPDLPDEWWRIESHATKSDILRAGAIYHHGGLYMDTDFLLTGSLTPVLSKLAEYDIVSYGQFNEPKDPDIPDAECGKHFSSNWHAGRKGNVFSATWWRNIRSQLTRRCPAVMKEKGKAICCHDEGDPRRSRARCNVPFGAIERLKTPEKFAKHKDPETVGPLAQIPPETKMWCLNGDRTPIPHINGEIYWIPWDPVAKRSGSHPWVMPFYKANCTLDDGGGLDCEAVQTRRMLIKPKRYRNFFGRVAYHLFFSTFHSHMLNHKLVTTTTDVLRGNYLISELLRQSLGYKLKA